MSELGGAIAADALKDGVMTMTLQRLGDEFALIFDRATLAELGIDEHTAFLVSPDDEGIYLKPIRFAADDEVDARTGRIMVEHAETLRKLAL